jgi:hypothetical protein
VPPASPPKTPKGTVILVRELALDRRYEPGLIDLFDHGRLEELRCVGVLPLVFDDN